MSVSMWEEKEKHRRASVCPSVYRKKRKNTDMHLKNNNCLYHFLSYMKLYMDYLKCTKNRSGCNSSVTNGMAYLSHCTERRFNDFTYIFGSNENSFSAIDPITTIVQWPSI